MALDGTYSGLLASVASWLKRADLVSSTPDLVVLAEARIARDLRLRAQIVNGTMSTTGGVEFVALPPEFLEMENITLAGSVDRSLTYETPEQIDVRFPYGMAQGSPAAYTIIGDRLYFGPCPDQTYTIKTQYYGRFAALAATPTNWLLSKHPSIYLFATLAEAAPFMLDDNRAPMWEGKYAADMKALQDADDESLRSGSVMRVRTII